MTTKSIPVLLLLLLLFIMGIHKWLLRRTLKWLLLLLMGVTTFIGALRTSSSIHPSERYQDCGGVLNASRGTFHTPNFPRPFPVPISCRWVIQAPPNKRVLVHLTQFYLREGVRATEYVYYSKDWEHVGEHDLGIVSADNRSKSLYTPRSYLALDLKLDYLNGANIRVLHSLMDVYGFNVTYEVVDPTEYHRNVCSPSICSFNGNCMASADYEHFWCQCFPSFFGSECQFGPKCDLERGMNICKNGGNCR